MIPESMKFQINKGAHAMINIEIKNSEKINAEKSAFISFPYNNNLVTIMRAQSPRFWHASKKEWEIPVKRLPNIIASIGDKEITISGDYYEEPEVDNVLPIDFEFKTKPFSHQLESFQFALNHEKFLLGDEQGLGKTKQVIDIAMAKKQSNGYKHCLIICGVNGLKWNWKNEVETHSNEVAYILGQRYKNGKLLRTGNKEKEADLLNIKELPYFLITNVESLRDEKICTLISNYCKEEIIEMVAIDEIHKCKNPTSQQGKAILKVLPKTRIAMTGTPLMNTPLDLFIILKWLGHEKHSFYQFKKHYCVMGGFGGYEIVGYRNLGELQESLKDIMLRRLKKEVLDLPEKLHTLEIVEMGKQQSIIYNEIKQEIKENIDRIKVSTNPLAQLIRLRQATGFTGILSSTIKESAKLDRLEELIEELVENDEKCIVFSNWTDMTSVAYERLKKYNPAVITGETTNRVAEQEKFMQDPKCKCIIGTIGAMGTGLTLTAATTVIFLDSPWTRANKEQAEDRAHRIGTKSNVNIITLVCKDTIDERIEELVHNKGVMADTLVDGKIDGDRGAILDFLLN